MIEYQAHKRYTVSIILPPSPYFCHFLLPFFIYLLHKCNQLLPNILAFAEAILRSKTVSSIPNLLLRFTTICLWSWKLFSSNYPLSYFFLCKKFICFLGSTHSPDKMLPLPITLPESPKFKLLLPLHYYKTLFDGKGKGDCVFEHSIECWYLHHIFFTTL